MEQENNLTAIYEGMYRTPGAVIKEQANSHEVIEEARKSKKKKFKGKKRSSDDSMIGAIEQVNSSYSFDNVFGKVLREMEEMGGDFGGEDDGNVFDAGEGYEDDFTGGGDAESILRSIYDQLAEYFEGGDEDEFGDEEGDDFDFEGDIDEGDDIPQESFTSGEGNPKGNFDGKARKQPKTTHVKDNGDVKFDQQDTGYDPEDVEGSEGSEHGAQGNYDGKARALPKTNHVKGNGDADFSKAKTGIKTSTGKKDKNYF